MKQKRGIIWLIIGIILLLAGIVLSVFYNYPHFYSFFAVGMLLILIYTYNLVAKKSVFYNWRFDNYVRFFCILIIVSVIINEIGNYFNYWVYPHYSTIYDSLIKYIFELTVPLAYFMILLMTGKEIFKKFIKNNYLSLILSLLIFVTLIGFFTEYINSFPNSWIVLSMPLTNLKIGNFFLIRQTIFYWLMALIPYYLYKIIRPREKILKK